MRYFKDGETIWIEPWRAKPFPVIKDLIVDRTAFDKIQIAGGFISVNTGAAPEANAILIRKRNQMMLSIQQYALDAVPALLPAKMLQQCYLYQQRYLSLPFCPRDRIEAKERVRAMVKKMDELGFGNCSNTGACEAECPKEIKLVNIARLNREYYKAY